MATSTEYEDGKEASSAPKAQPHWTSLPSDLLEKICTHLVPRDVPLFASVCKTWKSCTGAAIMYPADTTPVLIQMIIPETGRIRCYSPYLHKVFLVDTPLRDTDGEARCASEGWLTLKRPDGSVVMANPVTGATHPIPQLDFDGVDFFATRGQPPADDSLLVGFNAMCKKATIKRWDPKLGSTVFEFENNEAQEFYLYFCMAQCCNPVLQDGILYCVDDHGVLLIYDLEKGDLDEPTYGLKFGVRGMYTYLVDSEGELLGVVTNSNNQKPVDVLRRVVGEEEDTWEKVESLSGHALFTGTLSTFCMMNPPEWMANKIYFPRFEGRPEVVEAEFKRVDGRLFFKPKGDLVKRQGGDGACCFYDMVTATGMELDGTSKLLNYIWVDLSRKN